MGHPPEPEHIREYWNWLAVALFLLVTLDMLTTVFAAAKLGLGAEANPLIRWALSRGMPTLVALNLVVATLTVGLFWGLIQMLHQTPQRHRRTFGLLIKAWLGLLMLAGLVVLTNNLVAVTLGRSLV